MEWGRLGAGENPGSGAMLGAMATIPDCLSTFIRFIQLQSLRKRTEED
jgi:hypothetical protein